MQAKPITRFRGLNNVEDTLTAGLPWFAEATNVDITNAGKVERRSGYTRTFPASVSGAYNTLDYSRLYIVDGGALKVSRRAPVGVPEFVMLGSGLSDEPVFWTEINDQVFYNNGVDSGIVTADNRVLPWAWPVPGPVTLEPVTGTLEPGVYRVACTYLLADGRETGAGEAVAITLLDGQALQINRIPQVAGATTLVYISPPNSTRFELAFEATVSAASWMLGPDALGRVLETDNLRPLPAGATVIEAHSGQLYAAQHLPQQEITAVWVSKPLGFHLFDLFADSFTVPGEVVMLASHQAGLLIGTRTHVYALTVDGLATLADYGVLPGWSWDRYDDAVLFMTERGLCRGLPFANLTESHFSFPVGTRAGGGVIRAGGENRIVIAMQDGGEAFNQRLIKEQL